VNKRSKEAKEDKKEWGTLLFNCVKLPKMMGTEGVNMLFSVNFPSSTYIFTDFSSKPRLNGLKISPRLNKNKIGFNGAGGVNTFG